MTALAPGVTTISATVNGVTGSTPVVVQQPVALKAPAVITPGTPFKVTATLPNRSSAPLRQVQFSLTAPDGWTVDAVSPTSAKVLEPGSTMHTKWRVTAPAGIDAGPYDLNAMATFSATSGRGSSSAAAQVAVPYASFTAAYNNVGISDDANPTAGNLDGGGASYSAQALAAGTPSLTPGATVTHDRLAFTWSDAQPGTPDNVVAGGQTFAISGSGSTLGLLGAGDYGTASGVATITYTDGSSQSFPLSFADWWANAPTAGDDVLTTVPYINQPTGRQNQPVSIYYASLPIAAGKTPQYLTLPDVSQGVAAGQTAMHIFSVAIG
jgi:hypothetical protein